MYPRNNYSFFIIYIVFYLIITNILHNNILYAFLFYLFYHKLTINYQFFDIFFPHCKTASERFVI